MNTPPRTRSRVRRRRPAGFTLIETALATVIVGTGILAILAAQEAYHRKNDWAQRTGTAMLLANEIRELTLTMPAHNPLNPTAMGSTTGEAVTSFVAVDNFAGPVSGGYGPGTTFNSANGGPINATRQTIPNMTRWTQQVTVVSVLPGNISSTIAQPLGTTGLMRVTVIVLYQDNGLPRTEPLATLTWLVPGNAVTIDLGGQAR